ncbi:flagellar FliJ family protein [Nocardioides sp. Soil805]|uniref:flagellar FliJ family protein n=1 Tax=Nocardioides sp. Soil805 TaxID=1736416 RepID=UPI0007034E33|nr:flagellar FliJ family protein [Nocardioides sp. Soil805]KRF37459.1 hypothetical protein ASG94_09065 [Nocardioides sp. Soil805]
MASRTDVAADAGMRAVARVRGVRELDSRLGLARAAADEREAARRLAAVQDRLVASAVPETSDPVSFALGRLAASGVATELADSRRALAAAGNLTAAARDHWQRDSTRLSAVELLLERRQEQRRAERLRRETAEVDDLVAARWLRARRRSGGGAP